MFKAFLYALIASYSFSLQQVDQFYVHSWVSRIRAFIDPSQLKSVEWYKDGLPINLTALNAEHPKGDLSTIYFNNVTFRVNGVYNCEIVFKNDQRFCK